MPYKIQKPGYAVRAYPGFPCGELIIFSHIITVKMIFLRSNNMLSHQFFCQRFITILNGFQQDSVFLYGLAGDLAIRFYYDAIA
mgnify:CR=1 FL=1